MKIRRKWGQHNSTRRQDDWQTQTRGNKSELVRDSNSAGGHYCLIELDPPERALSDSSAPSAEFEF